MCAIPELFSDELPLWRGTAYWVSGHLPLLRDACQLVIRTVMCMRSGCVVIAWLKVRVGVCWRCGAWLLVSDWWRCVITPMEWHVYNSVTALSCRGRMTKLSSCGTSAAANCDDHWESWLQNILKSTRFYEFFRPCLNKTQRRIVNCGDEFYMSLVHFSTSN